MLREQALENATQVEKAYGAVIGEPRYRDFPVFVSAQLTPDEGEDEWDGIGDSSKDDDNKRDHEYEDEEMLATVTVIEDFDPDTIIHGPVQSGSTASTAPLRVDPKPLQSKPIPKPTTKNKAKAKKVRYETKDARRREQTKQRARRTEKAELAGGKASRNHKSSRGGKGKHHSKR